MDLRNALDAAFAKTAFVPLESPAAPPAAGSCGLSVSPALLRDLSRRAFEDIAFYLRRSQLALFAAILEDRRASENDRFVARALLRNALIAAEGELALCQDTGTAAAVGWKSESVRTGADDARLVWEGAAAAYKGRYLRSSQVAPSSFFGEYDTGSNLPAQFHAESVPDGKGGPDYRFLFIAKGGGSSNKTAFFQMTKALLEADRFDAFLKERVAALGTAACPPYRLAVVVGGTSPEENLAVLKLATTEILDGAPCLPEDAAAGPAADGAIPELRRDAYWERRLETLARESGQGAQFGGAALALDARVLRLPRHAASCPVSMGVSCSAHRNALARIDGSGAWIEALEKDPAAYLDSLGGEAAKVVAAFKGSRSGKGAARAEADSGVVELDLDAGMDGLRRRLGELSVGTRLSLNGTIIVARDAAHLRWHEKVAAGGEVPAYAKEHPVMYAGPSATPPGKPIGSFGPTTAQRMDAYAEEFLSRGASLVSIAKGNRSPAWREACRKYGGFYLGTPGGTAALIAEEHILSDELVDYPELGMESVRLIRVEALPAFLLVDDKGNDLYAKA